MVEAVLMSFVGWVLLAATAFRVRRELGIGAPTTIRLLRAAGAAILTATLLRCGAPLTGERIVRFLGAASLSGGIVVAVLSVVPLAALRRGQAGRPSAGRDWAGSGLARSGGEG